MRIGTWNLYLRAHLPTGGWKSKADWLDQQHAALWLLCEVSDRWKPRNGQLIVSPKRRIGPEYLRWAAIETTLPIEGLRTAGDPEHPGEEGLALVRVLVDGRSVLVACSVLPYSRAERDWGGLSGGQKEQFRLVLRHHLLRIAAERDPSDEPLIWGGDFNQQLIRPCGHGLMTSADELRSALEALGLTALTAGMADRDHLGYTIDHLAVSADWLADRVEVHRPTGSDGKNLSDHAAYTADVYLFRA